MNILNKDKPKQCDLSLPNQCMLKCKICNFWKNDILFQDANWLKAEDYKKLFYELRKFVDDQFLISFGGGEPLLYVEKLLDIAKTCKDLGFRSYFPTNAYLIDDAMAKRIAEAGIFSMGISLDSISRETHDFLRGRDGCWERAMRAIELLKKYSPELSINILTVIMEPNLEGIIDLTKWVYNNSKLDGIVFQAIQKPFNADCPDNWYELEEYAGLWPKDSSRVNAVIEELLTLRRTRERAFKISNAVAQLELFKLYFNNPGSFVKPNRCHLGDGIIRIDCFGNVMLCSEMDFIGNIKKNDICKIWHSRQAGETRMRISECSKNCYHLVNCYYDGESS